MQDWVGDNSRVLENEGPALSHLREFISLPLDEEYFLNSMVLRFFSPIFRFELRVSRLLGRCSLPLQPNSHFMDHVFLTVIQVIV
jgi:hypothetical protein